MEIRDKKGSENLVADHLKQLVDNSESTPLQDEFPVENLFSVSRVIPWYADLVNFLLTKTLPDELSRAKKDKIKKRGKILCLG